MTGIFFEYNDRAHEIALDMHRAPNTVRELFLTLPATIDIHCAKIAGKHIFWHAPFVVDLEKGADIMTLPAGTFLYWPERQFLELIYGELHAEKAAVTVLGRLRGDIEWLIALGDRVSKRQGHELITARLRSNEAKRSHPDCAPIDIDKDLQFLVAARARAWQEPPEDVARLLARRGMMLPFGPLAMAEAELRKLHELLWRLRSGSPQIAEAHKARTARFLIDAFVARIDGFCGMVETGTVLNRAASLLETRPEMNREILQELILYTGRMAAWLDVHMPWHDLNEAMLAAGESERKP